MLFEIRNYHFNPDLFEEYKTWAKAEALPSLPSSRVPSGKTSDRGCRAAGRAIFGPR
jgi:hypothetical protein